MSVLGKVRLATLLDSGELTVSPILFKDQVGDISIDLRLGNVALVVRAGGISHLDPREYLRSESAGGPESERDRRQKFQRFDLPFGEPLVLHPGTLTLAPSLEWVKLPKTLKGVVTARSSWAREGLNIATATFVDPDYTGIITLELSNMGNVPIALYPGMRVAQIAFMNVEHEENPALPPKVRQFNMSFEPHAGFVTKKDDPFIPKRV